MVNFPLGHLSYYAWRAWCRHSRSRVLLVDRASPRHKRDNTLREAGVLRLRADLAHLRLDALPAAGGAAAVVGCAKHLCGVATGTLRPSLNVPEYLY